MDLSVTDDKERRRPSVAANQCQYPFQLQMAADKGSSGPDVDDETDSVVLSEVDRRHSLFLFIVILHTLCRVQIARQYFFSFPFVCFVVIICPILYLNSLRRAVGRSWCRCKGVFESELVYIRYTSGIHQVT